jgi:AcrR family transcriptional regulator
MRDGSKTRLRIDQTAMRLFVEKGITETTVRDIAAEANIAEGTLYRHYPSKEELAWRLFVDNFTAIGRTLAEIQRSQDGIRNKLSAIIRYFCSVFDRDAVMFNYLFLARHQHMLRLTPRMPNPYLVIRSVVREAMSRGEIPKADLREAMSRGEIPKADLDLATSMVMGVILQPIDTRLIGRRLTQDVSSLADTITRATYRVLSC